MPAPAAPAARTALLALSLASGMGAAWTMVRWRDLLARNLPDPDDLMRLQQIDDWLAGQAFTDLTQHRIGLRGVAMHWSRLPDLIPAAMLRALRPLIGEAPAELAMLIMWPTLLFAALLWVAALLGRRIGVRPIETMLVALLAYPLTPLFAPGRIDHHGLQMVLLLAGLLALGGRATLLAGIGGGLALVASIVVGMETVPLFVVAVAVLALRWCGDRSEDARLTGLALATGGAAVAVMLVFATDSWALPACDGFLRQSWIATMIGAVALGSLAMVGRFATTRVARYRCVAVAGIGTVLAIAVLAPACRNPYGAVDPLLARLWLREVGEAGSILTADPRWSLRYTGLLVAAIVAGVVRERASPAALRRMLLMVAFASLALAAVQLRGAYGGIAVATILLADAIAAARRHGAAAASAMRLAGAGIAYPLLAAALPVSARSAGPPSCVTPATLQALAALPPARILAPVDLGPWLVRHGHHAIAAPYHRNAAGILATYRFAAAGERQRRTLLHRIDIDYVVGCDGRGLIATATPALWRVP